jgi:hypothetical protein
MYKLALILGAASCNKAKANLGPDVDPDKIPDALPTLSSLLAGKPPTTKDFVPNTEDNTTLIDNLDTEFGKDFDGVTS